MSRLLIFLCLAASIPAADAQEAPPDAAGQSAIIARMRNAALEYAAQLQDFVCTRNMTRSADDSGTGKHYKKLETQEGEVAYVSHRESYKPILVNGKSTNLDKRVKRGYFQPGGEFGERLSTIFDPKAAADFTWDHAEMADGRRSCVFRYDVPLARTTFVMKVNLQKVPLGHHGVIHADCETGAVTYFRMESDVPTIREHGHDIQVGADLEVHYGIATIGERRFLVPVEAIEVARFHTRLTKADIHYRDFRKYESSSTVTFEPPK